MALTSRHSSSGTPSPNDPPTPGNPSQPAGPSAAETNEAIRALVDSRAGRDWSSEAYEVLLIEWAAATRGPGPEIVKAA
ncbi:hypothetical protein [Streptomyces sp. NPDC002690]